MESFFSRYRNLLVLFIVLMVQIVGLAVQVRRTADGRSVLTQGDGPGVRLLRYWAESLVAPAEHGIHYSKLGLIDLWQNYVDLQNVRQQNMDLQHTIDRLRLEQASLMEDAKQGQRLQSMLSFQQSYLYSTTPAQIIGSSGSDQSRLFWIDKGSSDGLKTDMAVVTADGIVGKVRDVFPHTAQVLVINDQSSGAGVILETTRIRGVLRGNASGQLEIVGVMSDARIKPGEKVLTAGGDLIFPRGLPVGVVEKVVPDPDRDSCVLVMLAPAAHIDRLDEVLVITALGSRFNDQQQQDVSTSEMLKQADLNTLQEQKKASEIMAERLPGLKDPNQPAPPALPDGTPAPTPAATPIGPTHPQAALHSDRFSPAGAVGFSHTPAPDAPQHAAGQTGAAAGHPTGAATGAKPATSGAKPLTPTANGQRPVAKLNGSGQSTTTVRPAPSTHPAAATAQGRNQE
ncbi:rod shape-determining protein MreC [Telmatobacter bradus]|uniref:rod shape-determining protein MreC n=1 Tax=Telmatobacter bradus TaxID=474953 RepID=UPI003B437E78